MLVAFASLMHLLWGVLLLTNGGGLHIAATGAMVTLIPSYEIQAIVYIASALLPLMLLWRPGSVAGLIRVSPQCALLILSGASAIVAITSCAYADGTPRPWPFIMMDQGIYLVLPLLYAFESIDRFQERGNRAL